MNLSEVADWLAVCREGRNQLERMARSRAKVLARDGNAVQCRVLGGPTLWVDERDRALAPWLIHYGYWESWVTVALARRLKPGVRFVDVGANFGYYTVMAAAAGATVFALEPNRAVAKLVQRSLDDNALGGLVVQAAAGADRKQAMLRWREGDMGGASLHFASESSLREEQVDVWPLDELLRTFPQVDIVKIDAEGAEVDVWRGMRGLVERCRPIICTEAALDRQYDLRAWLADIQEFYPVRYVDAAGDIQPLREADLATVPPGGLLELWLET